MSTIQANYKILVVDGSQIVTERISRMLTELECIESVFKAFNYEQALDKLSKDNFDIVLLDTQLPGNNGFELLSFIKKSYPGTKTIILTNQSGNYYRSKGEKIGSDHFIDKSSEFEKIVQIINNYAVGLQLN